MLACRIHHCHQPGQKLQLLEAFQSKRVTYHVIQWFKTQNRGMTFGPLAKDNFAMYDAMLSQEKETWSQCFEADRKAVTS